MNAILGVVFHFLDGFASGSFYMAFKNVKGRAWESYWLVGGLFSWLIVPPLAAALTIPGFTEIIKDAEFSIFSWTYVMGVLLGVLVCLVGIAICGWAGVMKEDDLSEKEKKKSIAGFSLMKGLILATISGILSACFNFGIEAGKPMAEAAVAQGYDPRFGNPGGIRKLTYLLNTIS